MYSSILVFQRIMVLNLLICSGKAMIIQSSYLSKSLNVY